MKKRKGAAMIWACLLFLIGSLIVGTLTSWGISYHKKSVNEMSENQAYLTARSGAELIAKEIVTQSDTGKKIIEDVKKGAFKVLELKFGNNMGKCKVDITTKDSLYTIVSESEVADTDKTTVDTVSITIKETQTSYKVEDLFLGRDEAILWNAIDSPTIWEWKNDKLGNVQRRDKMPQISAPKAKAKSLDQKSDENLELGEIGKSTHYYFEEGKTYKDYNIKTIFEIDGDEPALPGNIYVYVKKGAVVKLKAAVSNNVYYLDRGEIDKKPIISLFIFVEEGGFLELDFKDEYKPAYAYVYATKEDEVNINIGENCKWYGGLTCYDIEEIDLGGNIIKPGYPAMDLNDGPGGKDGVEYKIISYGN